GFGSCVVRIPPFLFATLWACTSAASPRASAPAERAEGSESEQETPSREASGEAAAEPSDEEDDPYLIAERERNAEFHPHVGEVDPALAEDVGCGSIFIFCEAKEHGEFLVARHDESGNGVDGYHSSARRIYHESRLVLRVAGGSLDGQYVSVLRFDRAMDASTLSLFSRATETPISEAGDPGYGRAMLFLSAVQAPRERRGRNFVVVGPLYARSGAVTTERCQHDGDWELLPAVVLPHRVGDARVFRWEDDGRASRELLRVAPLGCPASRDSVGTYEAKVFRLYGRNAGVAIAVAGEDGRFRWALETRNAMLGSNVRWIGGRRGWIFGTTRSRHPGYLYADTGALFAIRVRDGAAVRIEVPGRFGDEMVEPDDTSVLDECIETRVDEDNDEMDAWDRAREDCEARVPSTDGLLLDRQGLHVQRPDGEWIDLASAELFRTLARIP
ncbi:MAG: hypothetical protein AAGE52_37060, partial [Myxococcota bacterium]